MRRAHALIEREKRIIEFLRSCPGGGRPGVDRLVRFIDSLIKEDREMTARAVLYYLPSHALINGLIVAPEREEPVEEPKDLKPGGVLYREPRDDWGPFNV